jgi:hypothetical protein
MLFVAAIPPLPAYNEELGVMPDEIWKALHDMLGPNGIDREDTSKWVMTTAWKDDVVRHGRGRFKKYLKQSYERRYQFRITLFERQYSTVMQINGLFRERPYGAAPAVMWKSIQPQSEDYILELEFFKAFLAQLNKNRLEAAQKKPIPQSSAEQNPPENQPQPSPSPVK